MKIIKRKTDQLKTKQCAFKVPAKLLAIGIGIVSTIWFLVRVIPKPSRAGYPCVRATLPFMSTFLIWLLSLSGSVLVFKKSVYWLKRNKYFAAAGLALLGIVLVLAATVQDAKKASAIEALAEIELPDAPNTPMGMSYGIFPGRVVWGYNPAATNNDCPNTFEDSYYMPKNNNQEVINNMADDVVKSLSGMATVKESWDAIMKDFNKRKTGIEKGYSEGQTIFIKINNGQAGWAIDRKTLAEARTRVPISGTSPSTLLAFVRQLVDSCGIPQNKVLIGEPMTHVYKHTFDVINAEYPDVVILDKEDHTDLGRTTSAGWSDTVIYYSDKGKYMPDGIYDVIMKEMNDADYMINIAALKGHARAGITLGAKNHLGSHGYHGKRYGWGTFYLHTGLVATKDNDDLSNEEATKYNRYRVTVDMMGHEKLGINTVLFVVDGLWGGTEAIEKAVKWQSKPFNNSWPNSIFVAQDQVAIESVCLDFLRAEARANPIFKNRPLFPAVDDYLHQAADKDNWPTDIVYDPEGDGTEISASLGVHEHWNNSTDKQYTQNLKATGKGIHLVTIPESIVKNSKMSERRLRKEAKKLKRKLTQ
ncbi:MAG: DUF362 domain-containing protein [Prolixibacteraceae bacterium]|nr:DUF362 domain-containing protein [Prolixibacteraceae bacterium]